MKPERKKGARANKVPPQRSFKTVEEANAYLFPKDLTERMISMRGKERGIEAAEAAFGEIGKKLV
jgi:hypothetical protein